jgi:hypothetical protein
VLNGSSGTGMCHALRIFVVVCYLLYMYVGPTTRPASFLLVLVTRSINAASREIVPLVEMIILHAVACALQRTLCAIIPIKT